MLRVSFVRKKDIKYLIAKVHPNNLPSTPQYGKVGLQFMFRAMVHRFLDLQQI